MISYGKFITSLFIFTLFICQGGVCSTLTNVLDKAGSSPVSHDCHNMSDAGDSEKSADGLNFTKQTRQNAGSDCCFDGTMNSRDSAPDIIQTPATINYPDLKESYKNSNTTYRITHNRGHPPGVPTFIQKSTLII